MAALPRPSLALLVLTLVLLGQQSSIVVEGITCGQIVSSLLPCLGYLTSGGMVSPQCCAGVKSVNGAAKGTPGRMAACGCLKQAAQSYKVNYGYAGSLAGKCGVKLGYPISPTTDCSKVH